MGEWTTNGNMLVELCKAVAHAKEGDVQAAAEALVIAFTYNNVTEEVMLTADRFAKAAGFNFTGEDA